METRAELAGRQLGGAIIEMINLMYQNKTAMLFLKGLIFILKEDLLKRKKEN